MTGPPDAFLIGVGVHPQCHRRVTMAQPLRHADHIGPVDITIVGQSIDGDYLRSRIAEGVSKLNKATQDQDYKVDEKDEVLRIRKGAGQIQLDEDGLYDQIVSALKADLTEISYTQLVGTIEMPDFQAIYDELAVEPQDAQFTETFDVISEVKGCWFDTVEAGELWKAAQPGDMVEVPLDITYPETTAESLRSMLYRDKLGSQTTYYTWSTDNRISNIEKVAEKLICLELYSINCIRICLLTPAMYI